MAGDVPAAGLRAATFAVVATALLAVEVGAGHDARFALAAAAVPVALAVVAARFAPAPGDRKAPPVWAASGLVALAAAPFALDPVVEAATGEGRPFELRMLAGLGYVALGLAALGRFRACLRLAAAASLFLTLFGLSLGNKPALLACLGGYTAAGVAWLSLAYRDGLRAARAVHATAVVAAPLPLAGRVPWGLAGLTAVLVGVATTVAAVGPTAVAAPLWELMPTSGGTGDYDRRARGGVNDGDEETTGKNAAATGMVDTDQFLESPLPSLYDAISDMYGKPHQTQKDSERTQALSATAKEQHGRAADSLRPSRNFPTSRQSPPNPPTPLSRAARWLFEVEGPTPLHVRAAVFHGFDGRAWAEARPVAPACPTREKKTAWMTYAAAPGPDVFAAEPVRHAVKVALLGAGDTAGAGGAVAALDGTLIPTAPHVARFRLGKLDQESFFACGRDGILRMAPRKLPGGVTLETDAHVPDPRKLAGHASWPWADADTEFAAAPTAAAARVAALAREWAGDRPRGWEQVAAVVARLRTGFVVDHATSVPPGHPDAAAFFLFESGRGPDYLFATTAAAVLRHLGYRTRLVAGFYAAPEMYDPETRHTPVGKENVHVWPEVLAGGDCWVVLEPTPGYEVLTPPRPWHERALAELMSAARWVVGHPVASALVGLAAVTLVWWRRTWLDALALARWRLRGGRDWRGCVAEAVRLVERRARWAGRRRPIGETPARHFADGVVAATAADRDALVRLAELAGWAAYAPDGLAPAAEHDVWAACDRAVRVWTYPRFRRTPPEVPA